MTDHADIDLLARDLPAVRHPGDDAPMLARLWWAVRTLWSRVHIRRWRTVRSTSVWDYQQHVRTGRRRVRHRGSGHQPVNLAWLEGWQAGTEWRDVDPSTINPPRGPSAVTRPHGNRDLAAAESTSTRQWAEIEALRDRQGVGRLTAMVNEAKDTPIPALDAMAASIQADRARDAILLHRLCTAPPTVTASEIFADLGIDPDSPPAATTGMVTGAVAAAQLLLAAQGQQSSAMWANVRAARLAAARAGNPDAPLSLERDPTDPPPPRTRSY